MTIKSRKWPHRKRGYRPRRRWTIWPPDGFARCQRCGDLFNATGPGGATCPECGCQVINTFVGAPRDWRLI